MAIIPVHSGDNLQTKINSAAAGDILELDVQGAGGTWDGSFTLPNTSGMGAATPITIRSASYASLPNGRVGPTDAVNMPRIRTTAAAGASTFTTAANAGWWILDGLEITDAPGVEITVQSLLDLGNSFSGAHDIVIKRLYLHQKETGTGTVESGVPYHRAVIRAVQFEGTTLLYKWCYLEPFIGYYYTSMGFGTHTQMETSAFLSVSGSDFTLEDNYLSAWWNTMFLGGGDTPPQNAATLTGATTTSATFSNTTGLSAGVVIRFEFTFIGTLNPTGVNASCNGSFPSNGSAPYSSATITRISGATLNSGDALHYGITRNVVDNFDSQIGVCSVDGSGNIVFGLTRSLVSTAGTVTCTVYETAMVTSVVGSTVNYVPFGRDLLASSGAQTASWNYGDQGLINDVTLQRNTIYIDPTFAADVLARSGATPKGVFEIKSVNRFTFEGNYVLGFPSLLAIYPGNQYGTAPWSTCKNVKIKNNWIAPDLGYADGTRDALSLIDASNYATITPLYNIEVSNNLIKNVGAFFYMKGGDLWNISHNTVLNIAPSTFGYHDTVNLIGTERATNWTFSDNIVSYSLYGIQITDLVPNTLANGFPAGVFSKNVVVNTANTTAPTGGPIGTDIWGTGSCLGPTPVYTSFDSVGFTNLAGEDYLLAPASPYKGLGSNGSDPGVDWAVLLAALPSADLRPVQISGNVTIQGSVVIG